MMGAPGIRPPVPDGLHWTQAESGEWIPLEVDNGLAYRLIRVMFDGVPSGEIGSTAGPLVKPAVRE